MDDGDARRHCAVWISGSRNRNSRVRCSCIARRALVLALIGMGGVQLAMAVEPGTWTLTGVFQAYMVLYLMCFVLMSVSLYAEAMRICHPTVAATQFSVFMAILNLATSFGAQRFGVIEPSYGDVEAFPVAGATAFAAAALFFATLLWSRNKKPDE